MLNVFLLVLAAILVVVCKRAPAAGCAYLLVLHMLIPPCARIASISFNTLMLLIVTLFFVKKVAGNSWRVPSMHLFPVKLLIIPLLILCLFAPLPINFQFSQLFQFFITEVVIFILMMYFIKNEDDLNKVFVSLRFAYVIVGAYGILTYVIRRNPLFVYFAKHFNYTIDFTGDGTIELVGGMTGRATGNLSGPLPWGQTSLLMLILFVFFGTVKRDKLSYIVVIVACLNCFLSTKRSVIVPMFVILIYLFVKRGLLSKRIFLKNLCVPLVLCALWNAPFVDSYKQNIVTAIYFWNDDVAYRSNVHGSSAEMRQAQLSYALVMVRDNLLCGLGYGYPQYYGKHHGSHSIMLGFESLVYQVLVPSGIIGLFIWFYFFYKSYRLTLCGGGKKSEALVCHGAYFLSCIMTGIQTTFFWYMVMVVLVYKKGTVRNEVIDNNSRL